tara:strand:- start:292 stop:1395 length:1104 start_codon:yes stop_codon:yes gene_type:complete
MSTDNLKGLAAPHASDSIYQEAKQLNAESRAGLSPLKPPPAGVQPLAVPVTIGEEDAALVGIGRRDALPVTESPPLGSTAGIERRDSDRGITSPWMKSQAHLLKPSETNPMPTAVPPPISANSGTLGVRHVLFIIGLPERGKPFIARRLKSYLSFFHGADVQLFDISEYAKRTGEEPGSDANARLLLEELKFFMEKSAAECGSNMHVHKDKRTSEVPDAAAPSAAAGGESPRASSGETPPLGPMRSSGSGNGLPAPMRWWSNEEASPVGSPGHHRGPRARRRGRRARGLDASGGGERGRLATPLAHHRLHHSPRTLPPLASLAHTQVQREHDGWDRVHRAQVGHLERERRAGRRRGGRRRRRRRRAA